jgi:hypothetical protein
MDFAAVVVGWWLVAAKKLVASDSEQHLRFMDGPYELIVVADGIGGLRCWDRDSTFIWDASVVELVTTLKLAAERILEHLKELHVARSEQTSLLKGIAGL